MAEAPPGKRRRRDDPAAAAVGATPPLVTPIPRTPWWPMTWLWGPSAPGRLAAETQTAERGDAAGEAERRAEACGVVSRPAARFADVSHGNSRSFIASLFIPKKLFVGRHTCTPCHKQPRFWYIAMKPWMNCSFCHFSETDAKV